MNKWRIIAFPALIVLGFMLSAGSSQAYVLLGEDWNYLGGNPVTVDIKVNPNCDDPNAPDELGACQNALNTWSNAGANFAYNYAGTTGDVGHVYNGQNTISWAYGGGGALATTAIWGWFGNINEADVAVWDEYNWNTSWPSWNEFDVESVVLHETGHVLGLDHSNDPSAVMWPYINWGEVQRELAQDDVDGILAIYGGAGGNTVNVMINPTGSVNIPSSGGSIPYDLEVHNIVTYPVTCDLWTEFIQSGGGYQELVALRLNVTLAAGVDVYRSLTLYISGSVPDGTYDYYLRVGDYYGGPPYIDEDSFQFFKYGGDGSEPWVAQTRTTDWDDIWDGLTASVVAQPQEFQVSGAYPNPFNPETTIQFDLPEATHISLAVYDLQGRKVTELINGEMSAGHYGVHWNAAGYPSGTYLYQLTSDFGQSSGKLVLMK